MRPHLSESLDNNQKIRWGTPGAVARGPQAGIKYGNPDGES